MGTYTLLSVIPPTEHEVLVFLCQVVGLLTTAKILGRMMVRVGQPSVVGELLAGVVLGPSLFGRVAPDASSWLFPSDAVQGAMLYGLAWVGLLLLLASTGFESDLAVIRQLGRAAVLVTAGSLLLPLAGGAGIGLLAPDSLLGPNATTLVFAAFLAVALSISSLPVVATVLAEMGLVRRNVGQLILAVAIANDLVGWTLLGIVAGFAESTGVDAQDFVVTIAGIAAFLAVALTIGQKLVDRLLRATASTGPSTTPAVVVFALVLGAGALTQWMGVEAVLGAFIAGLVVGRSRWRDERALRSIESLAHGLLAPLFFATAGLRIDLGVFTRPGVAKWSIIVLAVASLTKFLGALAGAHSARLPRREGLALGIALNARGALEIVIASIGLSLGVLNDASYGVIVVMALATSLAAPPLLRLVLADWAGTDEERLRLDAEQASRSRLVLSGRPPLLLTRGRPPSIAAAQIIDLCWAPDQSVVVLTTVDEAEMSPIRNALHDRVVHTIRERGNESPCDLLMNAGKGHGAIVMGVTDRPDGPVLSPFVAEVLTNASHPVVLVRGERMSGQRLPQAFARALVPVSGSLNSRASQEVVWALSARLGTELVLVHLDPTPALYSADVLTRQVDIAEPLLSHARATALAAGARPAMTISRTAESIPGELARMVVEYEADIVVIGANPIDTGDKVSLGPIAAHLLRTCPATVVVVVLPVGWAGHQSQH